MSKIGIPLATSADQMLSRLAAATGSEPIARLRGVTLLGERAMLGGMRIPARMSAGGGCRLFDAMGDTVALNLSRATDRELLPALFETEQLNPNDDEAIAAQIARCDAALLVRRGRMLGLAIAAENERVATLAGTGDAGGSRGVGLPGARATADAPGVGLAGARATAEARGVGLAGARTTADARGVGLAGARTTADARAAATAGAGGLLANACVELVTGPAAVKRSRSAPRVIDLSALWAGPLAAHLLWLAGAEVVKVESRTRPDAMRAGDNTFYALLNQGKASVVLDFREPMDKQTLLSLIATADIVIEAARPRALAQLGIDADALVRNRPGLVWMILTAHGALGDAANWVGFGDDCAVAGGLSAALRAATGHGGFVGDAIGDPLTGMLAALVAWEAWASGRGGRFALAMSEVVGQCLGMARRQDPTALDASLIAWSNAIGKPFPTVEHRPIGTLSAFGEHTHSCIADIYR